MFTTAQLKFGSSLKKMMIKPKKPKFSYLEPVVYSPFDWLKQNKIQATKLIHGIDPLRDYNLLNTQAD